MPSNWASAGALAVTIKVAKIRALMTKRIIAAAAAIAIATLLLHVTVERATAPDVRFATLAGKTISTAELRGKVVLVNFWATWCASCIKETPKMVDTFRKYAPRGYETVAVAVRGDTPGAVAQFAEARGLPYTVAIDAGGDVAQRFGGVRVTPLSVLIDRQGRIVARYVGEPDWAALHAQIERLL
jgi:peroxiredoxin